MHDVEDGITERIKIKIEVDEVGVREDEDKI